MSLGAPGSREGATLAEALVALVVGLLVVQLGLSTLARFRAIQTELAARSDALVALRVGRHVLRRELRYGVAHRDWDVGADSLWLRAFRSTGLVCANDSASAEVGVWYRGERMADASKDSVLILTSEGWESVHALVGSGAPPASCAAGGPGASAGWRLDPPAPQSAVLARVFERGSYHLAASALRYRRGLSGRQPLTPEVWAPSSQWDVGAARLGIQLTPSGAGVTWGGFLAWTIPE